MGRTTDRTDYHRKWRETNQEQYRAQQRAWREANKDRINEARRAWRAANRESEAAKAAERYAANREQILEKGRRQRERLREQILAHYGRACACCGEPNPEFLALDHINGGGNAERKTLKVKSGSEFYRYIVRQGFPDGYRILCHNCNTALGSYGYCPHQVIPPA